MLNNQPFIPTSEEGWVFRLMFYKHISSGTDDYRRGDKIRPDSVGAIGETSKIQEQFLNPNHL